VLLVSTAGFVVSYAIFAIGSGLENGTMALSVILISRILSGVCGANLTVAQAYIADLTPPHLRSKRMGLIGMAFGLGFICGPAIAVGALLWLGLPGPGWVAAGVCLVNFVLAWFLLGESRRADAPTAARPGGRFDHWREVLTRPRVGLLIGIFFLSTFVFSSFETTLGLLIAQNFHFRRDSTDGEIAIAFLFAFRGFIGALIQGRPAGRMVSRLRTAGDRGEPSSGWGESGAPSFWEATCASLSGLWRDPSSRGSDFWQPCSPLGSPVGVDVGRSPSSPPGRV
jgi:DHA1 family tetracycline resistance protein-like MFS transporter